ncbi:PREDICTED: transcription cofactor vestigial-like protein 4 [Nicrophorus vespilloides]|uniref:Transcription cofactor vestigial-like protein 4 n=1 Tax=Nicrophorus vespilloides TaxID=110193 RepID=A0ABM1M648_NICVS|nr:PREDICTED: transcription cofactor vestigial-like protein 4 [Nicrophorus vespilloides]
MEGGESPLEVLSRAATMVQETQHQQKHQKKTMALSSTSPTSATAESAESKQAAAKQLPTTKWKKDRRTRPEYLRKSDPRMPEVLLVVGDRLVMPSENGTAAPASGQNGNGNGNSSNGARTTAADAPLDMSVKQRGLPPTYSQAISDPSFRSSYRPAISSNGPNARDELPSGISMCDPIIDEHFRRSLGKDYNTVFSNNNVPKELPTVLSASAPVAQQKVIEMMDNASLSVDDHFAKALGDTWHKLNKKEPTEIKSNADVVIIN